MATFSSSSASTKAAAQRQWEASNQVKVIDDDVYRREPELQKKMLQDNPWREDHQYFKFVRMSALALLKIQMHAGSEVKPGSVPLEVMGILQGKIVPHGVVVMDVFALPVPAGMDRTATHVNPTNRELEFMVQHINLIQSVGKVENMVGWYHSHPGYGCWLSGIDVGTQRAQQMIGPMIAVVVDPVRSICAGKVEIGAFRTYKEGYTPPSSQPSDWQSVPSNRIEDFGVHVNSYYPLEMTFYKSTLDTLLLDLQWRKYWITTLAASPLSTNRDYITSQIRDVAEKIAKGQSEALCQRGGYFKKKGDDEGGATSMSTITRDVRKLGMEVLQGMCREMIKAAVFNQQQQPQQQK